MSNYCLISELVIPKLVQLMKNINWLSQISLAYFMICIQIKKEKRKTTKIVNERKRNQHYHMQKLRESTCEDDYSAESLDWVHILTNRTQRKKKTARFSTIIKAFSFCGWEIKINLSHHNADGSYEILRKMCSNFKSKNYEE